MSSRATSKTDCPGAISGPFILFNILTLPFPKIMKVNTVEGGKGKVWISVYAWHTICVYSQAMNRQISTLIKEAEFGMFTQETK